MGAPPVNIQKEAKRCEKTLVSLGKTSTYGVVFYEKHCKKDTDLSDVFFGENMGKPQILMVYHHFLKQKDSFRHTHVGCFTKQ
jgi:hypothetical protein